MRNDAEPKDIVYTMLLEKYRGYTIEWAITPARSNQGKWMSHFRAWKEGAETLRGSVGDLQDNEADAQNTATRVATAKVDEALGPTA
jgi:hypothetical protein